MKETLADIDRRGTWTEGQRRSLRAVFQKIADVFEGAVILRGKAVKATLSLADLPFQVLVPFPAKPRCVWVLSATKVSDSSVISNPPTLWTWSPSTKESAILLTDIDLLDGETYDLDIIMVKS